MLLPKNNFDIMPIMFFTAKTKAKEQVIIFLLLITVNIGFYALNINDFFVSDDFDWVHLTRYSEKSLLSYFGANYYGQINQGGSYRPIINLSFWLDNEIWGLNPIGYHLTNIIFYIATAWLIFLLVLLLFKNQKNKKWIAFLSALFFSLMPNHAEVAIWISGRCDAIATFFYLLSFYLFLLFKNKKKFLYFYLSLAIFIFSLLSKEIAITLPAVILLYELFILYQNKQIKFKNLIKSIFYPIIYGILVVLFFIVRYLSTGLFIGYYGENNFSFSFSRIYLMFLNLISDSLFFLTARLKFVNFFEHKELLFLGTVLFIIFLLIKIILKYRQELIFWFLFYFISMIPVINLIFGVLTDDGERFNYFPSVAVVIILAVLLIYVKEKIGKYLFYVLLSFLLVYFGYFTIQKSLIWNKASQISKKIVYDLPKVININSQNPEGVIVFSIPDNYCGAHLFRNGFYQAVRLFYPTYDLDAIILRNYLNLNKNNFDKKIVDWQSIRNGFLGQSIFGDAIFNSYQHKDYPELYFDLLEYNKKISVSSKMKIIFKPEFMSQKSNKRIYFIVYNEGKLVDLRWPD